MGNKTSHARLVQRKTGAGYQVSLLKTRAVREQLGVEALKTYLDKVKALPDAKVELRTHERCLHCLNLLSECICSKE